jgi:serine/threonine protein kinase
LHAHHIGLESLDLTEIQIIPSTTHTAPQIKLNNLTRARVFYTHTRVRDFQLGRGGLHAFVAPEDRDRTFFPGGRSDIFAIGALALFLYTNNTPEFIYARKPNGRICISDLFYELPKRASRDIKHFFRRTIKFDPRKRANIEEVSMMPWLLQWTREPIDFGIPVHRLKRFRSMLALDLSVLDEVRQGYWGWESLFMREEVDWTAMCSHLLGAVVRFCVI